MKDTQGKKRNDAILILVLALIASGLLLWQRYNAGRNRADELLMVVSINNEEVLRAPLTTDIKRLSDEAELTGLAETDARIQFDDTGFYVQTDAGENRFSVEQTADGRPAVRCSEADCPDLVCVNTGAISIENELIVCLPHRLSLRLIQG